MPLTLRGETSDCLPDLLLGLRCASTTVETNPASNPSAQRSYCTDEETEAQNDFPQALLLGGSTSGPGPWVLGVQLYYTVPMLCHGPHPHACPASSSGSHSGSLEQPPDSVSHTFN